jgi:uncharacterized protein (TIGR02145 family)
MTDARDNKTYQIRKFNDGNCWMVDNLRYGGTNNTGGDYCSGRASSEVLATYGRNTGSVNPDWHGLTGAQAKVGGVASDLFGDCRDPAATGSTTPVAPCAGSTVCGYYYNFQAAVQSANCNWNNSDCSVANSGQGICPLSWRLPTNTEIDTIISGNSFTSTFWIPQDSSSISVGFRALYSGLSYHGGEMRDQGSSGFVWSSTPHSTVRWAYFLQVHSGGAYTTQNDKYYAFPVRCIKN